MTIMKNQASTNSDQLKEMIGVVAYEIVAIVTADLITILKRLGGNNEAAVLASLDGYILALSRIIEKPIAWKCISQAFKQMNVEIPEKYYIVFNDVNVVDGIVREAVPKAGK